MTGKEYELRRVRDPVWGTRVAPKVMPPIYFHGNYDRYKEHNDTI
jgi:hypothetical protein